MFAIQILSDLHLESPKAYDIFDVVPKAPHLALLGDIGNVVPHKEEYFAFLMRQLQQFRVVWFVPGNHEAYGSSWTETLDVLRSFERDLKEQYGQNKQAGGDDDDDDDDVDLGRFAVLDRDVFELPSDDGGHIVILGCSLFSHIPRHREMAVEMGLQDFFQTTGWDARMHADAHERDLAWLNDRVGDLQQGDSDVKIVILTHWSPTTDPRSMDPKHINSPITHGFATELSEQVCFSSDKVVMWAFGHTHYNCDFTVDRGNAGPLRVTTNQRGYYFAQAQGFNAEKVVELP